MWVNLQWLKFFLLISARVGLSTFKVGKCEAKQSKTKQESVNLASGDEFPSGSLFLGALDRAAALSVP